ncbi:signal peptide prediction [Burkholderia sp. TSV86]|nr:signal peptide prediction [Burkholderia sp. TSV86]
MSGKVELRVLGTSVTLQEHLRRQAEQDLGIKLCFLVHDSAFVQREGVMHPERYDIYDQWFHSLDCLWPAHALQPIELDRIKRWSEINTLPRTGSLAGRRTATEGSVPADRLYVQPDNSLGRAVSNRISMLPLTHNADSFVYLVDALPRRLIEQEESWSWLLAPELAGRVALQADPAIGAIDAALAVQACNLAKFADIGNLTIEEIDQLINILIEYRQSGHFAGFWSNFEEAVQLMMRKNVAIQSIWSPATLELERAGLRFQMACPREGYRAWFGGLALSRQIDGRVRDAAYDYLNWWLDGWAGAMMARQGVYITNPERARQYMNEHEWAYWYNGKPVAAHLPEPVGQLRNISGPQRDGGNYAKRMSHIAVWDSVMDEHNYLVRRWNEFLKA